ncbi:MAG: CHAT domain-containing protein [Leptolyngbya sp. BL-A-14]
MTGYKLASDFLAINGKSVLWANVQKELGKALSIRLLGDRADNLEQAILHLYESLRIFTLDADPEQWASVHHLLGGIYIERIRGEQPRNIEQAIFHSQQALRIFQPNTHPEQWAGTQGNLATAFLHRIQGERAANLEQAIDGYQKILGVFSIYTHPQEWASTQDNLGSAYLQRVQGTRADNLERAIECFHQAQPVFEYDVFPDKWAGTQQNLGVAYIHRINGQRGDNLEQSIRCFQESLKVYTQESYSNDWAMIQMNLANAYRGRIVGNRASNLEQARSYAEKALQVYTKATFPENWARTQNALSALYLDRIEGDRADNLEQSISYSLQVLENCDRGACPEQWAQAHLNLGAGYAKRLRGERAKNLEQSITHCQKAIEVYTKTDFPEEWASAKNNLGMASLYRLSGNRTENLKQSIDHLQQALTVRLEKASPIYSAIAQLNLGSAYLEMSYLDHVQEQKAESQEKAIDYFRQVFHVCAKDDFPHGWATSQQNLGAVYSRRILGKPEENIKNAIEAYQKAIETFQAESLPVDCRRTAQNLGNLHFEQRHWEAAAVGYLTALTAAKTLYKSCLLIDSKAVELAETADLPRRATYALARIGRLQDAVLTLEQSRARGLSETLERDRSDLTKLQQTHQTLFKQYQDITAQLRSLETRQRLWMTSEEHYSLTPGAFRATAQQLHKTLTAKIEQIRQVEGYAGFLAQPGFSDIQQAVRPGIPLVYLVPTPAGSLALIVTQDSIIDVWFNDFTEISLREILTSWFTRYAENQQKQRDWTQVKQTHPVWQAFQATQSKEHGQAWSEIEKNHPVFQKAKKSEQAWLDTIDQVTHQLWQPLMAPLINCLKQHSCQQATLIPTGYLSLLPLHTTWMDDPTQPTGKRYALDEICFTYAPNVRSLNAAAAIAQRVRVDSILAIDNPRNDLPNSSREVAAAVATFPQPNVLSHEEATVQSVLAALPDCNFLHLSCHGTANLSEPLNSRLLMSNGVLTLRQLLDLRLSKQGGIRLAILSACETGLIGFELVDEAIGLPTGLLQAGVAGVIASLWSVSDLSTMMLLMRFYDYWRNESLEPAAALRHAQLWIRDSTSQQKATYFKETNPDIFQSLILLDPDYFAHPFHWAAFSYVGV